MVTGLRHKEIFASKVTDKAAIAFITLELDEVWFVCARPGRAGVTVCGAASYQGLIRLLLGRLVYIQGVDIFSAQLYMAKVKHLFVLLGWV